MYIVTGKIYLENDIIAIRCWIGLSAAEIECLRWEKTLWINSFQSAARLCCAMQEYMTDKDTTDV